MSFSLRRFYHCWSASGAAQAQEIGDRRLPAVQSATERRVALGVAGIDGGAAIEQSGGDFDEAAAGGHVERRGAGDSGAGVDGSTGGDERADDGGSGGRGALVGDRVERGVVALVEGIGIGAEMKEQFHDGETPGCGGGMQEAFSGEGALDEGGVGGDGVEDEAHELGTAGLHHAREQSKEDGGTCGELWNEGEGRGIVGGRDGGDGGVQLELRVPSGGELRMVDFRGRALHHVGGRVLKEVVEGFANGGLKRRRGERGLHVAQPCGALFGSDAEAGVRFAQAEPPTLLGLLLITVEELDEEGGELFGGAAKALAGEEGFEQRVLGHASVEVAREVEASGLAAELGQEW